MFYIISKNNVLVTIISHKLGGFRIKWLPYIVDYISRKVVHYCPCLRKEIGTKPFFILIPVPIFNVCIKNKY